MRDEFESRREFIDYLDEVSRYNSGLPPKAVSKPDGDAVRPGVPQPVAPRVAHRRAARSPTRQLGVRLSHADFELLSELAGAHAVPAATMARMLIARGVRAAAESGQAA